MTGGKSPEERPESAFDRFRRADPARSVDPDLTALRAAVDQRIAAHDDAVEAGADAPGVGGAPDDDVGRAGASGTPGGRADEGAGDGGRAGASGTSAAQTDDERDDGAGQVGASGASAVRTDERDDGAGQVGASGASAVRTDERDDGVTRAGRPSSPRGWMVAAAVATTLAVGAGGYIAGSQGDDSPVVMTESADVGDDSADVSVEQDADTAPERVAPMDTKEEAEASPGDADARPELVPSPTGPMQFLDEGLPTDAAPAEAWLLDPDTGEPESLGQYPVISAADALERLTDPRFRAGPVAHVDQQSVPDDPPPMPLEPGQELPWPVQQVRLVDAELVTATYQVSGQRLLLPTWHLVDDQGRTWPVLAVAEDSLGFTAP